MGTQSESREHWSSWGAWVLLIDFPDELLLGPFSEEAPSGGRLLSPHAASARIDGWFSSGRADWFTLSLSLVARLLERTHAETIAVRNELCASLRSGSLRLFFRRMAPPVAPVPRDEAPPASKHSVNPSPRPTATTFLVKLVDELGVPLSDIEVLFSVSGSNHARAVDGEGVARFVDAGGSNFAFAGAVDMSSVRASLRERWDQIREGTVLTDQEALVQPLRRNVENVSLEAEQLLVISVQPYVSRERLIGGHFDTSKCFLLPQGMHGVRAIVASYDDDPAAKLLIVGHTDRAGTPGLNDPLSLERAQALKDYLTDSVDGWLPWYSCDNAEKRWGHKEDQLMIGALPDALDRTSAEGPIVWYQRTRGLAIDGICGPKTRRKLIAEYMSLDGTSLPQGIEAIVHGCGESFPERGTQDGAPDPWDRRVEVFFFDGLLGVQPPVQGPISGPGSLEYPEWVRRTRRTADHVAHDGPRVLALRLHDGKRSPIPGATARVSIGSSFVPYDADADGFIFILLPASCPAQLRVEWGKPGTKEPFPFRCEAIPDCDEGVATERDRRRLHNLGYTMELPFETAARAFQIDYQVDHEPQPTGLAGTQLPPASKALLATIFEGECDASPLRPA